MIPILYAASETAYTSLGYGGLSDAISCEVRQEINGEYELFMQYPMNGAEAQNIAVGAVIKANANTEDDAQLFRVYRITKPISGVFGVYARHIFYDASGVPIAPFPTGSVIALYAAISFINSGKLTSSPLSIDTTRSNIFRIFQVDKPISMFSAMGKVLDVFGGEWIYNNFTATLVDSVGSNKNAVIEYGKNLTTLEQDTNCSDIYTGILPFYSSGDTYISGGIVNAPGTYPVEKVLPVDFSEAFENNPTAADLVSAAQQYISDNNIGVPVVSLSVQFVDLASTTEAVAGIESIGLGDTVIVRFSRLGVNATARVTSTVYNVLSDRYDSIHVGDAKTNIADTIVDQQAQINEKQNAIFKTNGGGEITREIDGVVEWLNPPMLLGVEYRTTKRHLGKPVYTKAIDFGALPNTTYKTVQTGITNGDKVLSHTGYVSTGPAIPYTSKSPLSQTVGNNPTYQVMFQDVNTSNVTISVDTDWTSLSAVVVLEYTKTTD